MNQYIYLKGMYDLIAADIDLLADTLKIGFLTSSHSIDLVNDEFWSDVSGDEISASGGYSTGGYTLQSKTQNKDETNIEAYLDCANPLINGFTCPDMQYIVLYKDTGDAATSPLIAIADNETPLSYTANNLTVTIPTTGIIRIGG